MTLCGDDQYFDVVVNSCSSCSSVCRPQLQQQRDYCLQNCPQYYREHVQQAVVTHRSSVSEARTSHQSTDHRMQSLQYRLVNQPLFWTSVVSMSVAVVSVITLTVLCITCFNRRRRVRVFSRVLRGNLSPAPDQHRENKLHRDDNDDDEKLNSIDVGVDVDEIDLRSTTPYAAGVHHGDRHAGSGTTGECSARTLSTAGGGVEQSYWSLLLSGHRQQSVLLTSRLHVTDTRPPPPTYTQAVEKSSAARNAHHVYSPRDVSSCRLATRRSEGMTSSYNDCTSSEVETSEKQPSSQRYPQQLSTVLTLTSHCSRQPPTYSECTERVIDAVGGLSHVTSIHHNQSDQMASSLGYGSCVH